MSKVCLISDYFSDQILGGGELNDDELLQILNQKGFQLGKVQSQFVTVEFLKEKKDNFYIVSNFCNLSQECKNYLADELQYLIYEHDHKYLLTRNPADYNNFIASKSSLLNYNFYKNAKAVICQSNFHKGIAESNLGLDNISSVGGNLWSKRVLEKLRDLSKNEKADKYSVLNSNISHKNTSRTVAYCEHKGYEYDLVSDSSYFSFLEKLGANKTFVFFPQTPETLSRVVVEARMMGMSVVANNLIGATQEPWFSLKGEELIDYMTEKREEVGKLVEGIIRSSEKSKEETEYSISILSTFYKGEEFLEGFLEDITSQTIFDKCELIFVDADSPGKEKEIVEKYMEKYDNIVYHRLDYRALPTEGINIGIQMASAKYLTFGFIDDRRRNDCLEILLDDIEKSDVGLVYGEVLLTDNPNETYNNNTSDGKVFDHSTHPFSRENMIKCLPGPMPLWKREIHDACGFFDNEECNFADDWDMWLRAVSSGYNFNKVEEKVGLYLSGGRSQQEHNLDQRREEARIFYKYAHLFGSNFKKYKPYFDQFIASN